MLRKLIKYDLKDLLSISWIFYIIVIILSLVLFIFNYYKLYSNNVLLDLIHGLLEIVLIVLLILLAGFTIFKTLKRFNRNLYSDEAYLTHTLPISKKTLYFSKIISSIIYVITSFLVVILSYILGISYILTNDSCFIAQGGCYSTTLESMISEYAILFNINPMIAVIIILALVFLEIMLVVLSGFNGTIINHLGNSPKKTKSIKYSFLIYILSILLFALVFYIAGIINPDIIKILSMKTNDLFSVIRLNLSVFIDIVIISIVTYFGIDLLHIVLGYKLFNKGVNLE